MKTHILFACLVALLVTACASNEGKKVLSAKEIQNQRYEYSKHEGNTGRDVSRQ